MAAAVANGAAGTALGILAAARALGLDFLTQLKERFDLVIPRKFNESALLVERLLAIIRREDFRREVELLAEMERVVAESPQVCREVDRPCGLSLVRGIVGHVPRSPLTRQDICPSLH